MDILVRFYKIFIVTALLVNTACVVQTPTVQPESTSGQATEPITFSDTVVGGRWTLDTIEVDQKSVDVSVIKPIQIRVSEPDTDTTNIYDVNRRIKCGDEPLHTRESYDTFTISPDNSIEIVNQSTNAESCGADGDDADRKFSMLIDAVTSYSFDKDVLIFSGVDEASGEVFTIRWSR